jgi:hypothetical protein
MKSTDTSFFRHVHPYKKGGIRRLTYNKEGEESYKEKEMMQKDDRGGQIPTPKYQEMLWQNCKVQPTQVRMMIVQVIPTQTWYSRRESGQERGRQVPWFQGEGMHRGILATVKVCQTLV